MIRIITNVMAYENNKRPLWQWIVVYVVIAGVIYGLLYYFVFAKKSGMHYSMPSTTTQTSPTSAPAAAKNTVRIANFSYSPATLKIKAGDSVTWTNQDSIGHSATADDKSFDTGILAQGQSGTITFTKAGEYTYHCSLHPNMQGTIIVQ